MKLSTADFGEFFEAIHGHPPFAWQQRLLEEVASKGSWPTLMDLPTGSGKTSALDVAVFSLALSAGLGASACRLPRRTIFVVDRRTIVDQAYRNAESIAKALGNIEHESRVVRQVALNLQQLDGTPAAGHDHCAPLGVHLLRGGVPRDQTFTHNPTKPLLAVSTVDQVGSRLLFRGYGVSPGMRPVHAGLLGNDVLFLLDEVHLSTPFRDTLRNLQKYHRAAMVESGLPDRFQVVEMSATPGAATGQRGSFRLLKAERAEPLLRQRLRAKKPTILSEPTKVSRGLIDELVAQTRRLAVSDRVVGVVVNRVATARAVRQRLQKELPELETCFVTGRMRPLDREAREQTLIELAGAGRPRTRQTPAVVIATQCIEAGADLDFDALVTECASLSALRQRFGRLNRRGEIDDAEAVVVVAKSDLSDKRRDPVYGDGLRNTWAYLESLQAEQGAIDFGIEALPSPPHDSDVTLEGPSQTAPLPLPGYLDAWAQTRPGPAADPEPALFLHGPDHSPPEMLVIWRADVGEELAALGRCTEEPVAMGLLGLLEARLQVCRPRSLEALSLPAYAIYAWLAEQDADVSDVVTTTGESAHGDGTPRPALLWTATGVRLAEWDARECRLKNAAAGAVLVVPSEYGGLRDGNWDDTSKEPVSDLGDLAQWKQTGRPQLRLHPALLAALDPTMSAKDVPATSEFWEDAEAEWEEYSAMRRFLQRINLPTEPSRDGRARKEHWAAAPLAALLQEYHQAWTEDGVLEALTAPYHHRLFAAGNDETFVVVQGRRQAADARVDIEGADDAPSMTGQAVLLADHLAGVADYARSFASALGLPADLIEAMELAGAWHDAGKADPRFQRMLQGGNDYLAATSPPLAKSALNPSDLAARGAQTRSRYPVEARHEMMSLALMQSLPQPELTDERWELVKHLVASHHGHARPFAPYVVDDEPMTVEFSRQGKGVHCQSDHELHRLSSGISDRFWALNRKYGWHGLAWLETILRLADHRRSEAETRARTATGKGGSA